MILTNEEKYYAQKGKKYRSFDGLGNHWDIIVQEICYHPEGYLWLKIHSMKNDYGEWMTDDGSKLSSLILDVQYGRTIEIEE